MDANNIIKNIEFLILYCLIEHSSFDFLRSKFRTKANYKCHFHNLPFMNPLQFIILCFQGILRSKFIFYVFLDPNQAVIKTIKNMFFGD